MVQFAGSYVLKSHDNYRPLLEKTGKIPADKIDAILQAKPTMDIKSLGGGKAGGFGGQLPRGSEQKI